MKYLIGFIIGLIALYCALIVAWYLACGLFILMVITLVYWYFKIKKKARGRF